jgi:hypothetical protein
MKLGNTCIVEIRVLENYKYYVRSYRKGRVHWVEREANSE